MQVKVLEIDQGPVGPDADDFKNSLKACEPTRSPMRWFLSEVYMHPSSCVASIHSIPRKLQALPHQRATGRPSDWTDR